MTKFKAGDMVRTKPMKFISVTPVGGLAECQYENGKYEFTWLSNLEPVPLPSSPDDEEKVEFVRVPLADFKRMMEAIECDERLVWCDTCGAWLDHAEAATTDDYTGCWKMATGGKYDNDKCKSYRATLASKAALASLSPMVASGEVSGLSMPQAKPKTA